MQDLKSPQSPRPAAEPVLDGTHRAVFQLSYPVVLSMLAQTVMGLVDTLFMGWVGTAAQGAVGLGNTVTWASACFFMGTLTAVNTVVSQRFGAGEHRQCGPVTYDGLVLAAMASVLLLGLGIPLLPRLITAFTADVQVAGIAGTYASIRVAGFAAAMVEVTLASFMRGIGDTKTPMYVAGSAMVLNIPLNYWLIFGGLGIPPLGPDGAAYATVVATVFSAVILAVLFRRPAWRETYHTGWPSTLSLPRLRQMVDVGLPIGGHWVLEMISWTAFTVGVAHFGAASLAAHNIALQVMHLSFMPGVGLSVAATTLVGQAIGARDLPAAKRSARATMQLAVGFMGMMACVFFFGGRGIATLFSRDIEVVNLAEKIFMWAAAFQVFDAMGMVSGGVLRGAAMTRFPLIVSLVCSVLFLLPGFYLFGIYFEGGLVGAWGAATAYIATMGMALVLKVRQGSWVHATPLDVKVESEPDPQTC